MGWWHREPIGLVSEGRQFLITTEQLPTLCDNEHPMRTGGMCVGGQEHWYTVYVLSEWDDRLMDYEQRETFNKQRDARAEGERLHAKYATMSTDTGR